jgi:uncharacterized protein (TIGR02466 family)
MSQLFGLFPTPVLRVEGVLDAQLLAEAREQALASHRDSNSGTDKLSHTAMIDLRSDAIGRRLVDAAGPHVVAFGEVLFGQRLRWGVKELWMNVLEPGGAQFMHSHANSFVSGIFYLTTPHETARTLFLRRVGGEDFVFKNDPEPDKRNPYNAERWTPDAMEAGDLLLYPSYLVHGVPPNDGGERVTAAFNAIPDRIESQGYRIGFSA